MKRSLARRAAGFTMVEISVVAALFSLLLASVSGVFRSSSQLASDSRATLRVHEEHRRNLEALATVLRAGELSTFSNFSGGTSTNPRFERVTGAGQFGLTTGGVEELLWVQDSSPVDGVGVAGKVRHVTATGSRLVADRVPKDGFLVVQDGDNLIVKLTTYYTTSEGKTARLSGESTVFVRN
jgi:prepilin-type N-terminal cleavage/methylation domain-containing protein